MTQHTDLIERLRWIGDGVANEAATALEAQAREIAELKAQESELCTLYGLAEAECRRLRRVFTYKNQPGNVEAWRFGEACRAAQPGGDPIDHGLSLLQKLQEKGYGIVAIRALNTEGEGNDRP